MRDAGHRTPDAGHRTSDIGHRTTDIGHRTAKKAKIIYPPPRGVDIINYITEFQPVFVTMTSHTLSKVSRPECRAAFLVYYVKEKKIYSVLQIISLFLVMYMNINIKTGCNLLCYFDYFFFIMTWSHPLEGCMYPQY